MLSSKNFNKNKGLIKIGALALQAGVLPSTINFYTNEGLLKEGGRSKGGYRLYQPSYAVARIKQIQQFQAQKRLTIEEIKSKLKT